MTSSRSYCYPTDCTQQEWAFVAPYLTVLPEAAGQRRHDLRAVFDALRWLMRAGAPWRLLPGDFPPWHAVYDRAQRWIAAGVFEAMVHDLRTVLRLAQGRTPDPSAAVLDARTLQSTPESGHRGPAMTAPSAGRAPRGMRACGGRHARPSADAARHLARRGQAR